MCLSAVSQAIHSARQSLGTDVGTTSQANAGTELKRVAERLSASGATEALSTVSASTGGLEGLSRMTLVASSLASIRGTLGIDLLKPGAPSLLEKKVQALNSAGLGSVAPPDIPEADIARLTSLAGAAESLKQGLGVDLEQPDAAKRLSAALGRLQAAGAFGALQALPFNSTVRGGLRSLMTLTTAVGAMKNGLGIDPLKPKSGGGLSALQAAVAPGGALASIASFVASASEGASPGLQLPSATGISRLAGLQATLKLTRRSLGLDLLRPDAGARLQALTASFAKSGVPEAAAAAPVGPAELKGAAELQAVAGAVASAKEAAGLDLMRKDAGARLDALVAGFKKGGAANAAASLTVPTAILRGLSDLVALGSATALTR